MPIKYQENTKKFGTEVPNTDLVLVISWYTKFLFPIDITSCHHSTVRLEQGREGHRAWGGGLESPFR